MTIKIRKSGALQALSLTPLIDVVFLLLIFFLVATRFAEEEQELELRLPSADEALPRIRQPDDITISVDDNGRFFVDNREVTEAELDELIGRRAASNPLTQSVIIRADTRVTLQPVMVVLNLCERYGAQHFIAAD